MKKQAGLSMITLFVGLLLSCEQRLTEADLLGTWIMDESVIDNFIAEARKEATDNEKAILDMLEPMLRKAAGKEALEFSETELIHIRGTKKRSAQFQVAAIEGRKFTILVDNREKTVSIDGDRLVISDKDEPIGIPYRRLSESESVKLNQRIELAQKGPSDDAPPEQRMMWVMNADMARATDYLNRYPDMLSIKAKNGETLLHKSVGFKKPDLVKLLLEKGMDANAVDKRHRTPLHEALSGFDTHPELLTILIDAGAAVDHKDSFQITPLYRAVKQSNLELAKFLLSKGAAADAQVNADEKTPFLYCVEVSQIEMATLLLDNGANFHATAFDSKSGALFIAAKYGSIEMLQFILDQGVDPNKKNGWGFLPIDEVRYREGEKLAAARVLVEAGADINARSSANQPLLISAVEDQDEQLVRGLLKLGADANAKSIFGKSALDIAMESNNRAIIALLQGS